MNLSFPAAEVTITAESEQKSTRLYPELAGLIETTRRNLAQSCEARKTGDAERADLRLSFAMEDFETIVQLIAGGRAYR